MDFRTPCQILLGVLLAATALSVLGLAADNVAYVNKHSSTPVDIHYLRWNETAQAQYSYWVTMDYLPSRFSFGPMSAMIATSLICGLVGAGVAVASWMARGSVTLTTSFSPKKPSFLPVSLVLSTITFLLSLAVSIYVWHPVMSVPAGFQESLPLPPAMSGGALKGGVAVYQSPLTYTPEVWNCMLSSYVVKPGQSQKLQHLCQEAGIARYMMLPVLVLSAGLLASMLWTWRQARVAAASEAADVEVKEVETVSVQSKE